MKKKHIKFVLIALIIGFYIIACLYQGSVSSKYSLSRVGKQIESIPLLEGHEIEQQVIFLEEKIRSLGLVIGEKDDFSTGSLVYQVLDANGKEIYCSEEQIENMSSGVIRWKKINLSVTAGNQYTIRFSGKNLNGNINIAGVSEEKGIKECDGGFKFDESQYDGKLALNISYELGVSNLDKLRFFIYVVIFILLILFFEKINKYKIWIIFGISSLVVLDVCYTSVLPIENIICQNIYLFICVMYILFATLQTVLYLKGIRKIEIYFLLMAALWGILYSIVVYPFNAPDEETHYAISYELSSVLLNEPVMDDEGQLIIREGDQNVSGDEQITMEAFFSKINDKSPDKGKYEIYVGEGQKHLFAPVYDYFFSTMGICVARIMNLNFFWMAYLGRVFSLIAYLMLMFWAIRITPYGKMFLLNLSQLPLLIVRVGTYNYDLLIIGLCTLLVVYILKILYEQREQIAIQDKIILFLLCVLILTVKRTMYVPVLFIVLVVPGKKFFAKKMKSNLFKIFLVIISLVTAYLVTWKCVALNVTNVYKEHIGDTKGIIVEETIDEVSDIDESRIELVNNGEYESFNVSYFRENIFLICKRVAYTMFKDMDEYIVRVFGEGCGAPYYVIIYFAITFFITLGCEEREHIGDKYKYTSIGILISFWMILMLGSMVSMNKITDLKGIWGLQGRYLYPLLPLCIFMSRKKVVVGDNGLEKYLTITNVVQLMSVLTILYQLWK